MSERYRARFHKKHTVLPVIHASTVDQALRNAQIAATAGAEGVFLVNHSISYRRLFGIHEEVHRQFPDLWIGLNCLDLNPTWVTTYPEADGMWADDAGVREDRDFQSFAERIAQIQRQAYGAPVWEGIYFGGVAFKGQRKVRPEHLADVARKAVPYMDVVTTSGPGTGIAADVEKIKTMKAAIGGAPLAIASGITPENVHLYMPHADCFLVATGISEDFENLSLPLTKKLLDRVAEGLSCGTQAA